MKKYLMLLGLVAFCGVLVAQQQPGKQKRLKAKKEKMATMKVAHLTKALDLTSAQAEKFWPIYNQHEDKKKALRKDVPVKRVEEMTEEEAQAFLDRSREIRGQMSQLDDELDINLRSVLSAKQIVMLHRSEKGFHQEVVKRYKKKRKKAHKVKDKELEQG